MSVRPVGFTTDGSVEVFHDEFAHGGTIPAVQIQWGITMDGQIEHTLIRLDCPAGCGSTSWHPVGGGAAPLEVQQLFVNKTERDGCACGQTAPGDSSGTPESHVRLNVNRMDGAGRWQLETPAQRQAREQAPNMFQVVYRKSDRLIVGLEPAGGVGPDNSVGVIHDMSQYEVLMQTDPAYLSADGERIQGAPA